MESEKRSIWVSYDKSFVDRTREHEVAHAEAREEAAKRIDQQYVRLALAIRTELHFSERAAKREAKSMLDELFRAVRPLFARTQTAATAAIHKDSPGCNTALGSIWSFYNRGAIGDWRAAIDRVLTATPLKAPEPR